MTICENLQELEQQLIFLIDGYKAENLLYDQKILKALANVAGYYVMRHTTNIPSIRQDVINRFRDDIFLATKKITND